MTQREVLEHGKTVDGRTDYCYFKKGSNDNLYILRFDEGRAEWELTMIADDGARAGFMSFFCGSLAAMLVNGSVGFSTRRDDPSN